MPTKTPALDPAILRQGDVLLVRVGAVPPQRDGAPGKGPLVLKEGEATGHRHQFLDAAGLYRGGSGGLVIERESALTHEEHSTVTVPAGRYDLPVQVEHQDDDEPLAVQD